MRRNNSTSIVSGSTMAPRRGRADRLARRRRSGRTLVPLARSTTEPTIRRSARGSRREHASRPRRRTRDLSRGRPDQPKQIPTFRPAVLRRRPLNPRCGAPTSGSARRQRRRRAAQECGTLLFTVDVDLTESTEPCPSPVREHARKTVAHATGKRVQRILGTSLRVPSEGHGGSPMTSRGRADAARP